MNKCLSAAIATIGLTASISAFAASGFYVSGGLGPSTQANMPSDSAALTAASATTGATSANEDSQPVGGRVGVGYNFDMNTHFGLGGEVGYGYYGETKYKLAGGTAASKASYTSKALDFLIVPTVHITDHWDAFAKLGYAYHTVNIDHVDSIVANTSGTEKEMKPMLGLGAGYHVTENTSLNLTYYHISGDDVKFDSASSAENIPAINAIFFGGNFTFDM